MEGSINQARLKTNFGLHEPVIDIVVIGRRTGCIARKIAFHEDLPTHLKRNIVMGIPAAIKLPGLAHITTRTPRSVHELGIGPTGR